MGQSLSCSGANTEHHDLFSSIQVGDLDNFQAVLEKDPSLLHQHTVYYRDSALHIAASNGQIEVLCMILDRSVNPDILNRHRQTPLMLAAMHGKLACVLRLLQAGANILMFDSIHGRTCLHYAAHYGHSECLEAILSAAHSSPVADSWGFVRFVNVKDANGATPLHLASRQRRPECVHLLLDSGALVCGSTGGYGCPGSTALHLAARGGSLDCVRALLAWGADRLQRDSTGRIPHMVAVKYKHVACAALLNPSSAEPLVWPSPLKFISELNHDTKVLLERALMEANREREKTILKGTSCSEVSSPSHSDSGADDISEVSDSELCCICFDQICTIEVQDCGHQMCAPCTLALCCHNKPNPTTASVSSPLCPFCRSSIARLVVANTTKSDEETGKDLSSLKLRKSRRSKNYSEGSSSFKSLSAVGSFGKMGRASGKVAADSSDWADKL